MKDYPEYTNSQIESIIDEHIHSARDRDVLKDRFINGYTFDHLAEVHRLSVTSVKTIVYKGQNKIFRHL